MKKIIASLSGIMMLFLFSCRNSMHGERFYSKDIAVVKESSTVSENPLAIPPLLKNRSVDTDKARYELVVQQGVTAFFKGKEVLTYGYNGSLLGPTIRVKRGQNVKITVMNKLREYTTVHWHGMLVPGDMDGGPHQVIAPDGEWTASFKVSQPAATAWYHPHGLGTTAIQVYKGLAGLFIVDDKESEKLNIPKQYGVNDIPLIVQDKRFTAEGLPLYITSMRDIMEGMKGNTILVNGTINPYLRVRARKYRFRLLNGSNARVYLFELSNGKSFHQIATDAGFLEKPVKLKSLRLSPGERAEIIVDFSSLKKGEVIYLTSMYFNILKFMIGEKFPDSTVIPARLTKIEWISRKKAGKERLFELQGMGHNVAINSKQMNIKRIDEYMRFGDAETWIITSSMRGMMGMMQGRNVFHNFHAHGIHFQIIERGGSMAPENERGWKDTVFLENNEFVKVITRFLYKGIFMYHCHILEHEDNGMMGQFKVE